MLTNGSLVCILTGSAGKREDDSKEDQEFYMSDIAPMLDQMAAYSQSKLKCTKV